MQTIKIPVAEQTESTTRLRATIAGVTPVLQHNPTLMRAASKEVKRTNTKKIPLPEEEAEAGCYRLDGPESPLIIPSRWMMRNIVEAGKAFQDPHNKRQTLMRTIAAALIPPLVDGFVFFDYDGNEIYDYEIDVQRVVIQRNAVMRARPRIDTPWQAEIEIGIDVAAFGVYGVPSAEQYADIGALLAQAMTVGGSKLGLGDFRPERGGSFGRYSLVECELEYDEDYAFTVPIPEDEDDAEDEEVEEVVKPTTKRIHKKR